ncbi:tRNA lysidine(34) synthetase TilS [Ornithinimicrobium cavernae]|uniref:tRNA lysidine(34) synthetase TilS n=1 Tax=Ornithinimicrobium cavernae TaxID=2666047 RepID=UPI000D69D514|nr:tRNA lysidine(34) synthetase TilS [Ornithinimicrobium cavernae]
MAGPAPDVAATRVAVRRSLTSLGLAGSPVLVACSGGADSLALAAAAGFVVPRAGGTVGAVVVDHGLQAGTAAVAEAAAAQCRTLGLAPVEVVRVRVETTREGPESAARDARHTALTDAAERVGAAAVLLGHTRDDQAEQVLLGLARGSGTRSLAGMPPARPARPGSAVRLVRPFLSVPRAATEGTCRELGLTPWSDPHNDDEGFTRVRARKILPVLERELGPGVAAALARTADLLRDDAEALDAAAHTAYGRLGDPPWPVSGLVGLPAAVRRRVWRELALAAGSPSGALTGEHLRGVDSLVTHWRGQGPVDLPGGLRIHRRGDLVTLLDRNP